MKIRDVRTVLLTCPCTGDPNVVGGARLLRSASFIEIDVEDDKNNRLRGTGETYVGYFMPEAVPPMVNFHKPALLDVDVTAESFDIPETILRLRKCAGFWALNGIGAAILTGIEAALWDLKGQIEGKPAWQLLKKDGVVAYDQLLCYATGSVSLWPVERLLAKFDYYISLGFKAVKVASGFLDDTVVPNVDRTAIGGDAIVEQEREKCRRIREHLDATGHADVKICFDAHQGNLTPGVGAAWDVDTAARVIEAVSPYGVLFYEEPLRYENVEGYAEVCRRVAHTGIPVAGGECLTSWNEWKAFSDQGGFDLAQPDAAFCCGMSEYVKIADMFHKQGKKTACHSWGAGAAQMQNVHAAFAAENTLIVELAPNPSPLHTEVCIETPGLKLNETGGYLAPPTAPGLGVRLTEETKKRFKFIPGTGEYNDTRGKTLDADDRRNIKEHDLHFDGFWERPELRDLPGIKSLGFGDAKAKARIVMAVARGTRPADSRREAWLRENPNP